MTALGGFILGSFLSRKSTPVVNNITNATPERPMTPTEIAEHEERLRRIKENEPKITLVASRELTEEDFIGLPMTKENMNRYYAWKQDIIKRKALFQNQQEDLYGSNEL